MKKGKLYVIEGLDGSGKATQAQALYEKLRERGILVRKVSFPNYASDSSAPVRMYLRGDFGRDPSSVNAYAASSFYAIDRYAGRRVVWCIGFRGQGDHAFWDDDDGGYDTDEKRGAFISRAMPSLRMLAAVRKAARWVHMSAKK